MVAFAIAVVLVRASLDLRSAGLALLSGAVGVAALVVLALALVFRSARLIGPAVALLCALYVERLILTGEPEFGLLAASSVAILLIGELSQWSLDSHLAGDYDRGLHLSRAVGLGSLSTLATATVILGLLAASVPVPGGVWSTSLAMASALGLLGLLSIAAARALSADRGVASTRTADPERR